MNDALHMLGAGYLGTIAFLPRSESDFDTASRIAPKHWQGGYPQTMVGFNTLVLCAEENQDVPACARQAKIIFAPMDDTEAPGSLPGIIDTAIVAAKRVIAELDAGKRVLVTCTAGRNRSGLVSALVLVGRYGVSGQEAVAIIKKARPAALTNRAFAGFLGSIPSTR